MIREGPEASQTRLACLKLQCCTRITYSVLVASILVVTVHLVIAIKRLHLHFFSRSNRRGLFFSLLWDIRAPTDKSRHNFIAKVAETLEMQHHSQVHVGWSHRIASFAIVYKVIGKNTQNLRSLILKDFNGLWCSMMHISGSTSRPFSV